MRSERGQRLEPIGLVAGLIALIVLCLSWLTYQSIKTQDLIDRFMDYDVIVIRLVGEIIQLDQTLTGTTRTAAVTGDLKYVARYDDLSERLDAAINEVIRLSPPEVGAVFNSETKQSNDALVAAESKAMNLIKAGRATEAMAILYSEEYKRNKAAYAKGILFLRETMDEVQRRAAEDKDRNATVLLIMIGVLLSSIAGLVFVFVHQIRMHRALEEEKLKSDSLLHNILPRIIANRLKAGEQRIADTFDSVTVLFADIEGFTKMAETIGPHAILEQLNDVFSTMDRLSEKYQLEKIKTIGDAYMVVGGVPLVREDHTEAVADMALEIQAELEGLNRKIGSGIRVRCGMHRGEVIAGVIGLKKFAYDLWGDTVNTASRMESTGVPGKIQCTSDVYDRLKDSYEFEERGVIQVKGKSEMRTFFLIGRKA